MIPSLSSILTVVSGNHAVTIISLIFVVIVSTCCAFDKVIWTQPVNSIDGLNAEMNIARDAIIHRPPMVNQIKDFLTILNGHSTIFIIMRDSEIKQCSYILIFFSYCKETCLYAFSAASSCDLFLFFPFPVAICLLSTWMLVSNNVSLDHAIFCSILS